MKVRETDDCIIVERELAEEEDSFIKAFETGLVTLMVGKKTKRINGIKVWKKDVRKENNV